MPIRLIIINENGESETKEFDQKVINLGRALNRNEADKNDVVLPVQYASKAHAQIVLDKEVYCLIDESKHGTSLNGRRLKSGEKSILKDGDRIGICEPALATIDLKFIKNLTDDRTVETERPSRSGTGEGEPTGSQVIEAAAQKPASPDTSGVPVATMDLSQIAQTLAQALDQVYNQNGALEAARRKTALQQALRAQIASFRREDRAEILSLVKRRFPSQSNDVEKLSQENTALKTEVAEWRGKQGLAKTAYEEMIALAQGKSFPSENELRAFCGNVKLTLSTLLEAFWDLDRFRRDILLEWLDMIEEKDEITPLQTAETPGKLRKLLLDGDGNKYPQQAVAALEKGVRNLAMHERALLKGYDNSIWVGSHKLLDRLDPQVLEHEIGNQQVGFGPLKFPLKVFGPLLRLFVWREYAKRFAKLKGEERSMFEALFQPGFKEGYEEEVKKRRAGETGEVQTKILRRKSEGSSLRKSGA